MEKKNEDFRPLDGKRTTRTKIKGIDIAIVIYIILLLVATIVAF
jgi:hypothetical protein